MAAAIEWKQRKSVEPVQATAWECNGVCGASVTGRRGFAGGMAKVWGLLVFLAALMIGVPGALQAQTFQAAQPLVFTMQYGGANPLPQLFTVASTGTSFQFSAATVTGTGGSWLGISQSGCCYPTPTSITVTASPAANLAAGTYTAQIALKSSDGTKTLSVPVSLIIVPATATAYFDSGAGGLTFSLRTDGNAPPAQTLQVRNGSTGTLNWTASVSTTDGGGWLSVSAASGTAPSILSVAVDITKLPNFAVIAGTFTGQVLLQTAGDSLTVPVTVAVGDSVFRQINPLNFTKTFASTASPLSQVITVASTYSTFQIRADTYNGSGGSWLTISPGTGCCYNTPQAFTVNVIPAVTLAAGIYTAEVIFKSSDGTQASVVPITLTIEPSSATPAFDSATGAVNFSMLTNGSAPPMQSMQIRDAGTSTLNWTAAASTADGAGWLTLSAVSGVAPYLLNVGVDLMKLPGSGATAGTFIGQILLQTSGDSVTVPVAVTVGDSVLRQINPLYFTKTYASTANPLSQVVTVASTYASISFRQDVVNGTGGSWLSISPGPGCCYNSTQAVTVAVNPVVTLVAGIYSAEIIFKPSDGSQATVVPVTLTVEPSTASNFFDVLPGELTFSMATKGNAPPTQSIPIRNAGTGTLNWTASASTSDGGSWLTLAATSGTAPSSLSVGIDPTKLPNGALIAGTFTGQVVLQTAGDSVTMPVTVTVGDSVFRQNNPLYFTKTALSTANPLSQVITVASTGASFQFAPAVVNSTGGSWLTLSPGVGCCYSTPNAFTVTVSPDPALPAGTYGAEIILKSSDGSQSSVVPVTLVLAPASSANFFDELPGELTFSMATNGTAPPVQALQIRNAGLGTLNWTASVTTADGASWLTLSSANGTAPSMLNVGIDLTKLPAQGLIAGTFTGQVVLQTAGDTVTVPVTVSVGDSVFRQINSLNFTKTYAATGNPLPQVITVASTNAPLSFAPAVVNGTGGSWLTISPGTGCCENTPQTFIVTAAPAATLAAGSYTAEIIFKSNDGSQSSVVPVTLTIEPATASFFDGVVGALTFSMVPGGSAPAPQSLRIRNAGTGPLNWTATASTADGGNWLTPASASGTAPSALSVGINPANLPNQGLVAGTFVGQVVLQTAGDSITVPVTVTVATTAFSAINQLDFAKATGGLNPAAQSITVTSTGTAFSFAPSVAIATGGSWLTISPGTGCCYNTPQSFTVTAAPAAGLATGTYVAEIVFKSNDGSLAEVVPVTLTVGGGPIPVASAPVFSPGAGTYPAAQSVTITDGTPGATFYYTTNGSTPTTGSAVYSGPIIISSTTTLQAIAVAGGYANSAVASAVYTITGPMPTQTPPGFASMAYISTGASAAGVSLQVVAADFNGDGYPDLATTNNVDASVSVLLGKGNGTFQSPVTYGTGNGPYGVVAGDFNGDGKPDLAVVNGLDNTVSILLNSAGSFPAKPSFTYSVGSQPYGVSMADFNHDGFLDLVVTNNASKTLSVLLGKGDGSFSAAVSYATGNYPFGTAVADFNNDGYPDLVVWNLSDNTVGVLLNTKAGTFLPQVTYATGADPYGVVTGDFNGDGYPDLAVADLGGNTVSVLLNNKAGGFLARVSYPAGTLPSSVLARDLNGDGVLDLATTNLGDGTVSVLLGKGDGTFLTQTVFAAGTQPYSLLAADFNGDGKPDLAVTSFFENTLGVLLQTSSGTSGRMKAAPPKTLKTVPAS